MLFFFYSLRKWGPGVVLALVLDAGRSFREAAIKQRLFGNPSRTKTQSLQFTVSVRGFTYVLFGVLYLEVFDWGLKLTGVVHSPTTVLKTCFSMMRGGGASMSRAKTSQPEGLATKYVHLFITWFNWNVAWFCASHVAGSTQWFLYGMLRLNPFDCWSNFLLWLCFVSFFYSYGGFQSRGTCFQLYTGFCWGKISQAQPFLSS